MASSNQFMRRALPAIAVLTTVGFYVGLKTRTVQEKRIRKDGGIKMDHRREGVVGSQLSGTERRRAAGYAVETHRSGGGI